MALAALLMATYVLGLLFSLKTQRELFAVAEHGEAGKAPQPIGVALGTLACVAVLVALVNPEAGWFVGNNSQILKISF